MYNSYRSSDLTIRNVSWTLKIVLQIDIENCITNGTTIYVTNMVPSGMPKTDRSNHVTLFRKSFDKNSPFKYRPPPPNGGDHRNACGQKMNRTCGNALRW